MMMMEAIKVAVGDTVMTFMWVFCASTLGLITSLIINAIGVDSSNLFWASFGITVALVFFLVTVFNVIGDALGGASFNPTGTASFYAAGVGADTLFFMALRFPAQTLGAVGGAVAIKEVIPAKYKHMVGGPSLKVDVHTGAIAEGLLTFLITIPVLIIMLRGPRSSILKTLLLSVVTVVFVVAGSIYTGPSMNPANAFGWAYVDNQHNTWEQFYVYWICPFIGAILAAWVFRALFPPAPTKQKKA